MNQNQSQVPTKWWGILAVATICSIPFAEAVVNIPLSAKRSLGLTLFDPLVWISAITLLACWLKNKTFKQHIKAFIFDCWPSFLLFGVGLASILAVDLNATQAKTLYLKSLIQLFEYCVLGVLVFYTVLSEPYWREKAIASFCVVSVFALLSVAYHVISIDALPSSHFIGGILQNRNTYGFFALFALPILWTGSFEVIKGKRPILFFAGICLAFALLLCTSGGILLGAIIAACIAACAYGNRRLLLLPIAFTLIGVVGPRKPLGKLIDSVQVYVLYKNPVTHEQRRAHTMRYYRWSANLEMLRANPRLGVGLGQYQKKVKSYYGGISLPEGRTDRPETYNIESNEPLSFGWFFLTVAETGLLGAGALLFLLIEMLRCAVVAVRLKHQPAWSIIGICAGFMIAGWFGSPLVRGCGGAFSLAMALAWSYHAAGRASKQE